MVVQLSRMSRPMPDSSILPSNCATWPFKYRSSGGTKVSVSRARTGVAWYAAATVFKHCMLLSKASGYAYACGIPSRLGHFVKCSCSIHHCGADYFRVYFSGETPRRSRQPGQREPLRFQFLLDFL
jgi:hypothetical protein